MQFHRNAKSGLLGGASSCSRSLVACSIRCAAAAFRVSPATAHRWWRRWQRASVAERTSLVCLCDRSSRPAHSPRRLPRASERAICRCRRRPAGGRGWWRARLVSRTRRSGRCCAASGSRGGRRRLGRRQTATSGRAPATCCTWTSPATRASCGRATASPATAHSSHAAGCAPRHASGTTTSTRSSTTTPGSPTPRSTQTKRRRRSPVFSNAHSRTSTSTPSRPGA